LWQNGVRKPVSGGAENSPLYRAASSGQFLIFGDSSALALERRGLVSDLVFSIFKFSGVQGTFDGHGAFTQYMGVDHGSLDIFVAEEFLDGADIVTSFE
jgi:hypothetical protein